MGDRGQILIEDTGVYLYTHWGGYQLKNMLQEALKKQWRWGDAEYLTRIIFDVMTKDAHDEETGFGIGNLEHSDLNHPLLIVDVKNQKIKDGTKEWNFEDFIKLKLKG